MVTSSLSERRGAGPGRSKACWIMADPFIVSSTMVNMVVRTVARSRIGSTLLVCLYCLQTQAYYRSHFLQQLAQSVLIFLLVCVIGSGIAIIGYQTYKGFKKNTVSGEAD